jgi:Flp pilus assembly protein TadB
VSAAVVGLLAAVAGWMLVDPRGRASVRRGRLARGRRLRRESQARIAAVVLAVGIALLVGGIAGVGVGLLAAVGAWVLIPRLETARGRSERERLERQAPLVVDLVSACLASGSPLDPALGAAARAVGDPAAAVLGAAVASVQLGADPEVVWRQVAGHEPLAGLARAVGRSMETGAPLADLLPRVAERARAAHRARVEARVRTVSVRLTAPLGIAFLPAFVLLGVVPVVAAWVGVLL